jgi:translation elongation factor EF-1alpha
MEKQPTSGQREGRKLCDVARATDYPGPGSGLCDHQSRDVETWVLTANKKIPSRSQKMKTYLTAEKFEEEVEKITKRGDKILHKVQAMVKTKVQALYDSMNDDQKARAQTRLVAKIRAAQRPKIISPGSSRFN